MKDIFNLYEGILDSDADIERSIKGHIVTAKQCNDWFKDNIPALYTRYGFDPNSKYTDYISIDEEGKIHIEVRYLRDHEDIIVYNNLPEFITFGKIEGKFNDDFYVMGDKITSLKGLPEGLPTLIIQDCPNLISFEGAPSTCDYIKVVNCPNIKSLRGLPKCKNIRFKNCPGWDVNKIAKFTNTKKSNIIVI